MNVENGRLQLRVNGLDGHRFHLGDKIPKLMQLFPCHGIKTQTSSGHRFIATIIFEDGTKWEDFMEFPTAVRAGVIWSKIYPGDVKLSQYDSAKGYKGPEDANLIITGSHTICRECRGLRILELDRFTHVGINEH